ncbi:lipopolysaccharide biosynthesis protein [Cellulomonas triticagri]|uniref:Lipopolysaccharide biosynthesis protein n=1 Tax=Cellulomonas triticagri TaxID=2483352 RepID=A0A3M2JSS6_9CELL|nr:oligosaccharide flippase family protein [Cellulomonas triticagri]RMI13268.1 hypothetical protein EBM89_05055 [Cellulomonas triticagri]
MTADQVPAGPAPATGPEPAARRTDGLLVAVARMAPLGVQLLATPFVLERLGPGAYAAWALMMTTINLLLTADLGVVGIMQRYHGVARGRADTALGGRITASVLLVLGALLVVVTVAGPWISRGVLAVVTVPEAVRDDAALLFRHAGTLAVLQLVALALSSYLAARSRFVAMAVQSLAARGVLAVGIVVALATGSGLPGLLLASFADAGVAVLAGLVLCRRHLLREVRRPTSRAETRELWAYSWRNQLSAVGFVAQRELDVVLAGILLGTAALASVSAAAPLTAAACLAPTVLLTPVFTSLSVRAGRDPGSLPDAGAEAERGWLRLVLPFAALALGVLPFAAAEWLGPEVDGIAPLTAVLAAGFVLTLAGNARAVVVRAAGRPGIETRSYAVYTVVKVVAGVLLALAGGMFGLAAAGVLASSAALVVLLRGSRGLVTPGGGPGRGAVLGALALALGTAAVSWAVQHVVDGRWTTLACLVVVGVAGGAVAALPLLRSRAGSSDE